MYKGLISYFSKERNEMTVRHLDTFKVIKFLLRLKKSLREISIAMGQPYFCFVGFVQYHEGENRMEVYILKHIICWVLMEPTMLPNHSQLHLSITWSLFKTIHSYFFWSEDLYDLLEKICEILNIKYTVPERFTAHRFLSAQIFAVHTVRLLDSYHRFR